MRSAIYDPPMRLASLALAAGIALSVPVASAHAAESSTTASAATVKPKAYKNCTALNKVYKHGVGRSGARDKTSGKRVTNFRVNTKVYNLNKKRLDRDKDGIACEKR